MIPGWDVPEYLMLAALPPLLIASGFFSGSETALFGMSANERMMVRRRAPFASRAIETLLAERRMLLITILLGNMTVNVVFFVLSSMLVLKAEAGVAAGLGLSLLSLLLIVLAGEVLPKVTANTFRQRFASVTGPPLLVLHRAIGPLRVVLDLAVVAPLARLTAPSATPPALGADELTALLDVSGTEGVIARDEQKLLEDVVNFSSLKVRDVMTPRVRLDALPWTARREEVVEMARETRRTKAPVYRGSLDDILGILHCKRYLLDERGEQTPLLAHVTPPCFVPESATLDKLLDHFRDSGVQLAIVVDEYGGTAGILALEDIVEEIVGDITGSTDEAHPPAVKLGPNRWRAPGDLGVHDWASVFGRSVLSTRASTLGGLILERLGRAARVGDAVTLANVRFAVEKLDRARIVSVIVTLLGDEPGDQTDRTNAPETSP